MIKRLIILSSILLIVFLGIYIVLAASSLGVVANSKKTNDVTCCVYQEIPEVGNERTCFKTSIEQCRQAGGAVSQCIKEKKGKPKKPKLGEAVNYTLVNATRDADWIKNLTQVVNGTGIAREPYNATIHDCDDFADELERNLTAAGYDATFTAIWCYDAAGNPTTAHAVTDVHTPDGSLLWIEPQTGQIINLDYDGDGKVEARTHHEKKKVLTDDSCEIEVYDSKTDAGNAGVPID